MAKSNNLPSPVCLFDSDVLINWLTKEEDPLTHEKLWEAPLAILRLVEKGNIKGFASLLGIMEIRFVLRRKKDLKESVVQEHMDEIIKLIDVIIPDEVNLLQANNLQSELPFSPMDAVITAVGLSMRDRHVVLLTRDKTLSRLGSLYLPIQTPEEFLLNIPK